MISAIFRRGGDVAFVVEELKAVFDPQGGQWMGGRYVPSLLAAIGEVIETHMIRTGFLVPERHRQEAAERGLAVGKALRGRRPRPRQALPALQLAIPVPPGRLPGLPLLRLLEVRIEANAGAAGVNRITQSDSSL